MPDDSRDYGGLLLIDKPSGPTSHDIVAEVRRLLGVRKVGHAGTLDPLASGLLVVMLGRATKLAPFIPGDPKIYEGSVLLGLSTDSMDAEGMVVSSSRFDGGPEKVRSVLSSLKGEMKQIPPMYSAVKYRGQPLYRYARRGESVPRKSRSVHLYDVEMTGFRQDMEKPEFDFVISCSPGFYVREFAARIGDILGCGAVLTRLQRNSSGPFNLREALNLEELSRSSAAGGVPLLPLERALDGFKKAVVNREAEKSARNGAALDRDMLDEMDEGIRKGDAVAVMDSGRKVIGLHIVVAEKPFASRPRRII